MVLLAVGVTVGLGAPALAPSPNLRSWWRTCSRRSSSAIASTLGVEGRPFALALRPHTEFTVLRALEPPVGDAALPPSPALDSRAQPGGPRPGSSQRLALVTIAGADSAQTAEQHRPLRRVRRARRGARGNASRAVVAAVASWPRPSARLIPSTPLRARRAISPTRSAAAPAGSRRPPRPGRLSWERATERWYLARSWRPAPCCSPARRTAPAIRSPAVPARHPAVVAVAVAVSLLVNDSPLDVVAVGLVAYLATQAYVSRDPGLAGFR